MTSEEKAIHIRSNSNPLNVGATEMYNVTKPKIGLAVFFNLYNFKNNDELSNLPGGRSDTERLCHTLNELQFIAKEHENMNSKDILRKIDYYAKKDHTKYGCFMCVLSSHGNKDSIFGSDGVPISVTDLMNSIADCKTLEGKPKIFFVDACRNLSPDDRFKPDMTKPDCVICYSTLQGKTARMMASTSEWKGSYFIKSLSDVLCTFGQELPFHSIMEKLKQAVTKSCGNQSIEIRDSTTKVISFVPDRNVCQTCTNLTVNAECHNCQIPHVQNDVKRLQKYHEFGRSIALKIYSILEVIYIIWKHVTDKICQLCGQIRDFCECKPTKAAYFARTG